MSSGHVAKKRRLSPPAQSKGSADVPGFATWNLEQDYERRPRKNKKETKSDKLPVKTLDGWKENERHVDDITPQEENGDADSADGAEDEAVSATTPAKPVERVVKPRLPPKEEIRQAKEELARIAGKISEDPEENIGQLGGLAEVAQSENVTVKKLALATQLAVYKDIIPGYRIRPLSKDELQGKLSKDIRKLRGFEQSLLSGYKEYVHTLGSLTTPNPKDKRSEDSNGLASVATTCACSLITAAPHFNCRNDLLVILVRKLSTRKADADFTKCRDAMEELFREDEDGHASLEAVGQLTKMMKTRNYQIHEQTLNTFLHLRLLSEFARKASTNSIDKDETDAPPKLKKSQREFRTKKERKRMKERKQVEKEMREADAVVSHEERDKNQAETLKLVFVAYFRILKARLPHLMGAVLEGLAQYAHLINQDFFGDILEALKDLINDAEALLHRQNGKGEDGADGADAEDEVDAVTLRNASREALLCVITAFALLQGQYDVAKAAHGLSLDLDFFITHLFRSILPLALNADIELGAKTAHLEDPNHLPVPTAQKNRVNVSTTTVLLLRSLQSVLLPPSNVRAVPPVRVAAFVKQLMTLILHVPQKSATALLGLLQIVTKTHTGKVAALWNTEERKGDGVFDALSAQVASSNPFASSVWEGELLRLHYDPAVRDTIRAIEKTVVIKEQ